MVAQENIVSLLLRSKTNSGILPRISKNNISQQLELVGYLARKDINDFLPIVRDDLQDVFPITREDLDDVFPIHMSDIDDYIEPVGGGGGLTRQEIMPIYRMDTADIFPIHMEDIDDYPEVIPNPIPLGTLQFKKLIEKKVISEPVSEYSFDTVQGQSSDTFIFEANITITATGNDAKTKLRPNGIESGYDSTVNRLWADGGDKLTCDNGFIILQQGLEGHEIKQSIKAELSLKVGEPRNAFITGISQNPTETMKYVSGGSLADLETEISSLLFSCENGTFTGTIKVYKIMETVISPSMLFKGSDWLDPNSVWILFDNGNGTSILNIYSLDTNEWIGGDNLVNTQVMNLQSANEFLNVNGKTVTTFDIVTGEQTVTSNNQGNFLKITPNNNFVYEEGLVSSVVHDDARSFFTDVNTFFNGITPSQVIDVSGDSNGSGVSFILLQDGSDVKLVTYDNIRHNIVDTLVIPNKTGLCLTGGSRTSADYENHSIGLTLYVICTTHCYAISYSGSSESTGEYLENIILSYPQISATRLLTTPIYKVVNGSITPTSDNRDYVVVLDNNGDGSYLQLDSGNVYNQCSGALCGVVGNFSIMYKNVFFGKQNSFVYFHTEHESEVTEIPLNHANPIAIGLFYIYTQA